MKYSVVRALRPTVISVKINLLSSSPLLNLPYKIQYIHQDKNILLTKFESTTKCESQKGAISTYPDDIPGTSRPVITVNFCTSRSVSSGSTRNVEKHSGTQKHQVLFS
jgi:hypothetical protein